MKTVTICNERIKKILPDTTLYELELCGDKISLGLIDVDSSNLEDILLKEKEVYVLIKAFSCNYRDKTLMLSFNQICKEMSNSQKNFYSPFGSEFVATVIKVGSKVKSVVLGDRVIPNGVYPYREGSKIGGVPSNYASQRMQIFEESQLIKIPKLMSNEVAAGFTIASQTAYSMIRKLDIQGGENILVTAATSNTSLAIISALRYKNVNIYVVTSSLEFKAQLFEMGVNAIIPYDTVVKNEVKSQIGNLGFDIVIDPFFDIYFNYMVSYMNFNGKYIYCGLYLQNKAFSILTNENSNYVDSMTCCVLKNITIIGNCLGDTDDLLEAINDFTEHRYNVLIDSVYKNGDVIPFVEKTFHQTHRLGKIIYCYD